MKFSAFMIFLVNLALPVESFAENAVGVSSISLPHISRRWETGLLYEGSQDLNQPFLGILDRVSMTAIFYPKVKLIEPSHLVIENNRAVLKKGNSIDFDADYARLLILSPRAFSCYFSKIFCLALAPLSMSIFDGGSNLRVYTSPILAAQIQLVDKDERRWFSSLESVLFENEILWTAGLSL